MSKISVWNKYFCFLRSCDNNNRLAISSKISWPNVHCMFRSIQCDRSQFCILVQWQRNRDNLEGTGRKWVRGITPRNVISFFSFVCCLCMSFLLGIFSSFFYPVFLLRNFRGTSPPPFPPPVNGETFSFFVIIAFQTRILIRSLF